MNKKAYIQTLEAVVAALIIFIFITSLLIKNQEKPASVPADIKLTQESILKEIQSSNFYRNCILNLDEVCIKNLLTSSIDKTYDYAFSLCNKEECRIPNLPEKDIYAKSIIVAANLTNYSTTSVNLYIWRKA